MNSHTAALRHVANGTEGAFRPELKTGEQRRVWNDFMQLQMSQMIAMNESVGYLCHIHTESGAGRTTTVLASGECPQDLEAQALEVQAKTADDRYVLLITMPGQHASDVMHKVGTTIPVSDDLTATWSH